MASIVNFNLAVRSKSKVEGAQTSASMSLLSV